MSRFLDAWVTSENDLEVIRRFESKVNLPIDLTSFDYSDKEKNDDLKQQLKKYKLTFLASVPIVKKSIERLEYRKYVEDAFRGVR